MKTKMYFFACMFLSIMYVNMNAQTTKKSVAIINIESKDVQFDSKSITNLVMLELEKSNVFEVMDKYEIAEQLKKNNIEANGNYSKSTLIEIGKILKADKMLTGSVEKFGDKIVIILRLIDVQAAIIEKSDVMEYINQDEQIQIMLRLSINNLVGIPNDKVLVDLMVNYEQPILAAKTTVNLSGPRVGAIYTSGEIGDRLQASKSNGGFDMFPVTSMIGYQFEKQYLSAGDFQALFEFIPVINSLESGVIVPSVSGLLGFRFNNSGLEFGLGPVFRLTKQAQGYYDADGNWHLKGEMPSDQSFPLVTNIDSRGVPTVSTAMIFSFGKTFKSGYLNMPLNLYVSPRKQGTVIGLSFGFNIAKKPKSFKTAS